MRPLDGIKVLDLTRLLPGAVATMMLGDFGADVLKIEEPGRGDPARHSLTSGTQSNQAPAAYFLLTNRNKRSLTLNLKTAAGRRIFRQLAAQADVIVEGFRPGVMERLGLSYETLRAENPRLIYCALTGYGQTGPYRHQAGHDANYLSVAGVLGLIGAKDGPPALPGVQLADLAGGSLHSVIGILLALQARAQTGLGQFVDVAMTDAVMALLYLPFADYWARSAQPPRGNDTLSGKYACYHLYETRDGRWLTLGALEPKFWQAACEVLECAEFVPQQFNVTAQPQIIETLQTKFKTRAAADWLAAFASVDSCLTLVNDLREMVNDPQIQARGMITTLEHPLVGSVPQIAPTVQLSATPGALRRPPPALGEHTHAVLTELGYAEADIVQFAAAGVT